jgi:hypothetical protein
MKDKLLELYGFIEHQLGTEHDWYVQKRLREKLEAINTLLVEIPFGLKDILKDFDEEMI